MLSWGQLWREKEREKVYKRKFKDVGSSSVKRRNVVAVVDRKESLLMVNGKQTTLSSFGTFMFGVLLLKCI